MSEVRLVELGLPVFEALAAGDTATAERLLGLPVPPPFAEAVDIWRFMLKVMDGRPDRARWAMHAVVTPDDEIVGNAGFKGEPVDGLVELGYRITAVHRRRGHALASVRLLLDAARREPGVDRVIARISPDNDPSVAVVTAAGFVEDGEWLNPRWGRQLQYVHDLRRVAG